MKNKAILSILLFVFTYTKAEGQTIVYTYMANVSGGWNFSAPGGHGAITGPTFIGFITGVWGRYNHEFRIK